MAEGKRCIECKSVIPKEANVCRYCGQRIEGIKCTDCACFCKPEAKVCSWCGKKFTKQTKLKISKPIELQSSFWGTFLTRLSFHPQEANFSNEKILIRTYGFLGLTKHDEEIPWEKIAGFQHKDGIIWDAIWIETRGQSSAYISALKKSDSLRVKALLQRLEK